MKSVHIIATTPMNGGALNPNLNVKLHEARNTLTSRPSPADSALLSELIERMRAETRQLPLRFRIQQSQTS